MSVKTGLPAGQAVAGVAFFFGSFFSSAAAAAALDDA
jgi:hypothetical protein